MEVVTKKETSTTMRVIKGVILALIITAIAILIFAIILTYTELSEDYMNPTIIGITAISILISSALATRRIGKNGMFFGAIIGFIYICILYLISSLLNWKFGIDIQALVMIVLGILGGVLGGIIGVNKK